MVVRKTLKEQEEQLNNLSEAVQAKLSASNCKLFNLAMSTPWS